MPSPVNKDNFPVLTNQTSVCQRLGNVLAGYDAMAEFLDWLLNDSNEISDEVLAGFSDRMTPVGTVLMYAGGSLPSSHWRLCNGIAVSRTEYQKLFAVIGTLFGGGDGTTTFNLPNMEGRFPVGAGGTYSRGSMGGEAAVTLTVEQLPKHRHSITFDKIKDDDSGGWKRIPNGDQSNPPTPTTFEGNETGGDKPHENLPPYFGIPLIIKVL